MSSPVKKTDVDSLTAQLNDAKLDTKSNTTTPPHTTGNRTAATTVPVFSKQDAKLLMALATLNGWQRDEKASDKEALKFAVANVSELRDSIRSEEGAVPVAVVNLRSLDKADLKVKYFKTEFKRVLRELEVEHAEQVKGGDEVGKQKESTLRKAEGED